MGAPRARLSLIFLTVFIDLIGFGIVIPILPLYAREFGATEMTNGCLVGIYSLMQLFSAPILGRISDRVGRRPILMVSLLGTAIGFFLLGGAGSLILLFIARMVAGLLGGTVTTAQAYIADVTPPQDRAKAMGLIGAAFGLGFVFGPAIGGIMSRISVEAPFYLAGSLALMNIVLVYFRLPESLSPALRAENATAGGGGGSALREVRHLPLLLLTYFLMITGFSIMTTNFALFTLQRFHYSEAENGYLFAFIGVVGVIMQGMVLRRILRKRSERRVALAGGLFLMGGLILLPLCGTLGKLLLVMALIGIGNSLVTPTLTGLSSRLASAQWQGRVIGLMQAAASLARWLGPWVGGFLLSLDVGRAGDDYGRTPFWVGAGLVLAATLWITRLPEPKTEPEPEAEAHPA